MRQKRVGIGIIGFGNMGQAIAELLKREYTVWVFDIDRDKTKGHTQIQVAASLKELIDASSVLVLAVKPQHFSQLLSEIKGEFKDKLVISIAAGITTDYIEKTLGNIRVIRTMPNMPCRIAKGLTCLAKGRFVSTQDLDFVKKLLAHLGETLEIEEKMMNAATAISGNGPAYVCQHLISGSAETQFLKEFQRITQNLGFSAKQADLLVRTTFEGTKEFLKQTNISPGDLKKQVASKGGSTEAALEVLDKGGSLEEAINAALKRADELSKRS